MRVHALIRARECVCMCVHVYAGVCVYTHVCRCICVYPCKRYSPTYPYVNQLWYKCLSTLGPRTDLGGAGISAGSREGDAALGVALLEGIILYTHTHTHTHTHTLHCYTKTLLSSVFL